MRTLLREPLLHFVLIGALLFAGDALRRELGGATEEEIVVSDLLREELAQTWEASHGEPPGAEQLDRLVEGWIDEEVLYREGIARGFQKNDPAVRARVASQMISVLRAALHVPEPTEDELRAYYEEHRDRWARGFRVDFTHVFVTGHDEAARRRADELLATLRGGATPARLGDRFSGGRRYRQRELDNLEETFGESFARGLDAQPVGEWRLRESRFGLHLVRVDRAMPAVMPDFDSVRADVRKALMDSIEQRMLAEEVAALRGRWEIERR